MNIRKKTLNILSTAFLVVSLIVAGGIVADGLTTQRAEASFDAQATRNLDKCYWSDPILGCSGLPLDCLCPIVITPELEPAS